LPGKEIEADEPAGPLREHETVSVGDRHRPGPRTDGHIPAHRSMNGSTQTSLVLRS
jgi:hypothetical protein